jgi:hypothetical protein
LENYFNYFTEIEEQFRKCRAEPVLLSPLDWALIESWKDQGFPLEAVLLGIERAFEKFKNRQRSYRKVNTLAYCSQQVYRAVEESHAAAAQGGTTAAATPEAPAPFSAEELARFLSRCAATVENASATAKSRGRIVLAEELTEACASLRTLAEHIPPVVTGYLEELERSLTVLEEKMNASLLRGTPAEELMHLRAEVDRGLVAYRRRMPAAEVDLLQRRTLQNHLLEHYGIPRLSLFYL